MAFAGTNAALASAAMLTHPSPDAPITINTSDHAVHEQWIHGTWQPLAFFSCQLRPAECRESTFDRELQAMYLAVQHFRSVPEGRLLLWITN